MYIDICIPFDQDRNIATAYNRAVNNSIADWILLLDYDVTILDSRFYSQLLSIIKKVDSSCGLITCYTNRLGHRTLKHQLLIDAPQNDDLEEHAKFSDKLYNLYGSEVEDITQKARIIPISGFFMLLPRKIAESVGFRGEGLLGCDNNFCADLISKGYTIWLAKGLYVFHRYKRSWKNA